MNIKHLAYRASKNSIYLRGLAAVIDAIILLIIMVFIDAEFNPYSIESVIVWIVYCTVLESFFGFTIGKLIFRLRVVDLKGNNPKWYQGLIRNGLFIFEKHILLTFFMFIGLYVASNSKFKQRIGDKLCKTYVIYNKDLIEYKELMAQHGEHQIIKSASDDELSDVFIGNIEEYDEHVKFIINNQKTVRNEKKLYENAYENNFDYLNNISPELQNKSRNSIIKGVISLIAIIFIISLISLIVNIDENKTSKINNVSNIQNDLPISQLAKKQFDSYNYQDAIETYKSMEKKGELTAEEYLNFGISNYYLYKYNDALRCFDNILDKKTNHDGVIEWKVAALIRIGKLEEAKEIIDEELFKNADQYELISLKGEFYYMRGEVSNSLSYFEKAISMNPAFYDGYKNKISALYELEQYDECIEFINESSKRYPNNVDFLWYLGDCYSIKELPEKAIETYLKVSNLDPENSEFYVLIAWEYFSLRNYDKAKEYADIALDIYSESEMALYLLTLIEEEQKPESERISNFVKNNYLYYKDVLDVEDKIKSFSIKGEVTIEEITEFINSIRNPNDAFTFVLSGEEYLDYINEDINNFIQYEKMNELTEYIRIKSFTSKTALEVRRKLEQIENTNDKKLVIDLRNNPGGLAYPTNKILDILLPKCVTSYMIDRDGNINTYESNEYNIKFKEIFIFVNNYSASSSELLSLSLKKYLNNVTIVGMTTYGKGVSQTVFQNKEKNYIVFLVSNFWNVKEENIMGLNIVPDIKVEADENQYYFNELQ